MNENVREQVLGELHLRAILPALSELYRRCPEACELTRDWDMKMQFRISGETSTVLHFESGKVSASNELNHSPDIDLVFLSSSHLNDLFLDRKFTLPWIGGGITRIHRMGTFTKLTKILRRYLEPTPTDLEDKDLFRDHTCMALGVGVHGISALAQSEPHSMTDLANCPRGVAEFIIESEKHHVWADHSTNGIHCGYGQPPSKPDVRLIFQDTQVAFEVLNDQADIMAYLGLGKVRVEGLLPLADGLNLVMERIRHYLP